MCEPLSSRPSVVCNRLVTIGPPYFYRLVKLTIRHAIQDNWDGLSFLLRYAVDDTALKRRKLITLLVNFYLF